MSASWEGEGLAIDRRGGEELIIDVPQQLSRARRAAEAGLTAFAAVLWLLAVRPLLLVGIWYLGGEVAYTHMVKLEGYRNPGYFQTLALLAAALAGLLFVWSRYNAWRFRSRERRSTGQPTSDGDLAAFFLLTVAELHALRQSAQVTVARPERTRVLLAVGGGPEIEGRHDPLGPRRPALPQRQPPAERLAPPPLARAS